MAHNATIYRRENVIDINFNEFFSRMVGYAKPMGEGWYRITDYQTTGYLLDRTRTYGTGKDQLVYGCKEWGSNVGNTENEPLIVRVTIDPNTGLNRHDHRVYSELYPEDEIYWTWDWGFTWDWYTNQFGNSPYPIEDRFTFDSTLFGADSNWFHNSSPLFYIESAIGYGNPETPLGSSDERSTIVGWHIFDPNQKYFEYYKGFIYSRKDTKRNIKGPYDWRNVFLARYSSEESVNPWNGGVKYSPGETVVAEDGWIYVALQINLNQNPIRYDAYNNPFTNSATYGSLYPWNPSVIPPTSAFAPKSMRRAWLRLWPQTYKWFSPWANGSVAQRFYIGNEDLPYIEQDALAQPIYFELDAGTFYAVKTFSGENDSVSIQETDQNQYDYIYDIDLGTPSNVPVGPVYHPPKNPNDAAVWANQFGDNFWAPGVDVTQSIFSGTYASEITHPISVYGESFVNDNRIVMMGRDPKRNLGDPLGGYVKGIRFGNNSAGNTFYVIPSSQNNRAEYYQNLYTYINNFQNAYPLQHLVYGYGWVSNNSSGIGISELGREPLEWPINLEDIDTFRPFPLHEMEIWTESGFANNDFGDNFVGNVAFGALTFYGENYSEFSSPYIDNAYLSVNTDGAFNGCKFKNSNRYNLFLHGLSNVEIDSSESSVFETLSNFKAIECKSDLIRDCYNINIGKSYYNSFYHLIDVNMEGIAAHNYVDSLYSTSIADAFWYNSIGFFYIYNGKIDPAAWPNTTTYEHKEGAYFESGMNRISSGYQLNRHRGWVINNSFEGGYYNNGGDGALFEYSYGPSYIQTSNFGPGIIYNSFYDIKRADVKARSLNGISLGLAKILPLPFDKTITDSAKYSPAWELTKKPLLIWWDENGIQQVQKYDDFVVVVPSVGPPYPKF